MTKAPIKALAATTTPLLLIDGPLWAQTPSDADRYVYGPHMMWWGGGWYGMLFGPIFMVLVLAALIALTILLVRWLGGLGPGAMPPSPNQTPIDILKERFARGEIDKDEYEERRRILGG